MKFYTKVLIIAFVLGLVLSVLTFGQANESTATRMTAITNAVEQAMDSVQTVAGL